MKHYLKLLKYLFILSRPYKRLSQYTFSNIGTEMLSEKIIKHLAIFGQQYISF